MIPPVPVLLPFPGSIKDTRKFLFVISSRTPGGGGGGGEEGEGEEQGEEREKYIQHIHFACTSILGLQASWSGQEKNIFFLLLSPTHPEFLFSSMRLIKEEGGGGEGG